jgi:hypothetical protein
MWMRFKASSPEARVFGAVLHVNQFPRRGRFDFEFRQFATMMGLDVLVGVAMQRSQVSLLSVLPGNADHAPDRGERMMAQAKRDDLLLAFCDLLFCVRGALIAATTMGLICRVIHVSRDPDPDQATGTYARRCFFWSRYSS